MICSVPILLRWLITSSMNFLIQSLQKEMNFDQDSHYRLSQCPCRYSSVPGLMKSGVCYSPPHAACKWSLVSFNPLLSFCSPPRKNISTSPSTLGVHTRKVSRTWSIDCVETLHTYSSCYHISLFPCFWDYGGQWKFSLLDRICGDSQAPRSLDLFIAQYISTINIDGYVRMLLCGAVSSIYPSSIFSRKRTWNHE